MPPLCKGARIGKYSPSYMGGRGAILLVCYPFLFGYPLRFGFGFWVHVGSRQRARPTREAGGGWCGLEY